MKKLSWYSRFSQWVSRASGKPGAFASVLVLTAIWALIGPIFGFSDTWQLVMNTISSIVTFLMVFVIQNTQNRQTEAMQIKLDELIRATEGAHNALLDLEEVEDDQLVDLRTRYATLARTARVEISRRRHREGKPQAEPLNEVPHGPIPPAEMPHAEAPPAEAPPPPMPGEQGK
jgi:low affinity Fe/Cu permease